MPFINATGIKELRSFLREHHKNGQLLDDDAIFEIAQQADEQLNQGHGAQITLASWNTINGKSATYAISAAGIDHT